MLQSFQVKNYRCFESLTLDDLGGVNLIAGKNNVGKTTILEALYLHGNPAIPHLMALNTVLRTQSLYPVNTENLWDWLFFDHDTTRTVELEGTDRVGTTRVLRMQEVTAQVREYQPLRVGGSVTPVPPDLLLETEPDELILVYEEGGKQVARTRAFVRYDQGFGQASAETWSDPAHTESRSVWLRQDTNARQQSVALFSDLKRQRREREVIEPLRVIDGRLQDLDILETGGVTVIHADVGLSQLIPVPLLGEGIGKLLLLLLVINQARGGVVVVDEIENGLHHSVLEDVWRVLGEASHRSGAQLFATTHSYECVEAGLRAFCATPVCDFRLHRLERVASAIQAVTYDPETLDLAIKAFYEVR